MKIKSAISVNTQMKESETAIFVTQRKIQRSAPIKPQQSLKPKPTPEKALDLLNSMKAEG